jgi:hypothetical protein
MPKVADFVFDVALMFWEMAKLGKRKKVNSEQVTANSFLLRLA